MANGFEATAGGLRRDDVDRLAVAFEIVLQHPAFFSTAPRVENVARTCVVSTTMSRSAESATSAAGTAGAGSGLDRRVRARRLDPRAAPDVPAAAASPPCAEPAWPGCT